MSCFAAAQVLRPGTGVRRRLYCTGNATTGDLTEDFRPACAGATGAVFAF